jgi:hypothetical protein
MRPMHPNEVTLGDYLDDTLSPSARERVDEHLTGCVECRGLVADLREVGQAVAALGLVKPPARTWARIADAMVHDRAAGRDGAGRHIGWWMAVAAALLLTTLVGLRMRTPASPPTPAAVGPAARMPSVEGELVQAEQPYQKAISGLEDITNTEKGTLDPQTAATLARSLAVVDQAIRESRAALSAQPESEPAQASLLEDFKTKIALLENTVALINDLRKGEGT